eukprot:scaffold505003_cov33-Prasinocladus_malaysianus.AAC.1
MAFCSQVEPDFLCVSMTERDGEERGDVWMIKFANGARSARLLGVGVSQRQPAAKSRRCPFLTSPSRLSGRRGQAVSD